MSSIRRDAFHLGQQGAHAALEDACQKILLAADVVVQAALVEPYRIGDVLHGRRVVALLAEQAQRGGVDLLAALARSDYAVPARHCSMILNASRSPRRMRREFKAHTSAVRRMNRSARASR